jgi:glucokinase
MTDAYYIGIDVGATSTKVSVVTPTWQIREHQTIPSNLRNATPDPFLKDISTIVDRFFQKHAVDGIGIALCSLINQDHSGAFLSVNAPALNNLDIKSVFEKRFAIPVRVINDVNAFALAEYHLGAGRNTHRMLCLALGTGLAVSALINGQVIELWGGVAADAARIILDPTSTRSCQAGVFGSAEALLGTAYIEDRARELYGQEHIIAHQVITAAREVREPIACQVMSEVGQHAGHLLALLSPVFFPERIIITGGTAQAGDSLFSAMRERYQSLIGNYFSKLIYLETGLSDQKVEIVKGLLGPDAATIGAVLNILDGGAMSST